MRISRETRLLVVLLVLQLGACAAPRPRPGDSTLLQAQQVRETSLRGWQDWGFSGRIAVSGGGESGSGRVEWQRRGADLAVSMQAPVSRQSWRLLEGPEGARLEGLEGGVRHGPDAQSLLRSELGWSLPLSQVEAWIRGLRAGPAAQLEFDAAGLPQRLREGRWEIEYRGWNGDAPPLPKRVYGHSGEDKFRLVIDRWQRADF